MNSYNYKGKNDFDDVFIKHQTKTQFKDRFPTDIDRHNSKRSSFIDCFTNDSIINPTIKCPPGANCIKNKSRFANSFHCPTGYHYSTETYKCEPFVAGKDINRLGSVKLQQASNRKSAFFNSLVE
jgi:hypothetical protein